MALNTTAGKKPNVAIILFFLVFMSGCVENTISNLPQTGSNSATKYTIVDISEVTIAKWYNGHKAAISVTYDNRPAAPYHENVEQIVEQYGMRIDYEMVTSLYMEQKWIWDYFFHELLPRDYGYFGHGHYHVNHDEMTYDEAYESFHTCYTLMKGWGLSPVAYAYPGGYNFEEETRRALKDAGFLSGRNHVREDFDNAMILSGNKTEPDDWFALPSLVMQDIDYQGCWECINENSELIPLLMQALDEEAWLISTYHSIGDTSSFGWYSIDEFEKDIRSIAQNDFWTGSLAAVTLYIKERNAATGKIYKYADDNGTITRMSIHIDDNLPDDVYSQPLSVEIQLPPEWTGKALKLYKTFGYDQTYTINDMNGYFDIIPGKEPYYLEPLSL